MSRAFVQVINVDEEIANNGSVSMPGNILITPITPLVGARVHNLDLTKQLTLEQLDSLTKVFLRYKVLHICAEGKWAMDIDQHTKFCQTISQHCK